MPEYNICTQADLEIFEKQCAALEKTVPNLKQVKHLEDVDGSETKVYNCDGKMIEIHNSYYIDAVYVRSEFDLEQYF